MNKPPMQYGLYNQDTGILVYSEDAEFSDEEDDFRIFPTKIIARQSVVAKM